MGQGPLLPILSQTGRNLYETCVLCTFSFMCGMKRVFKVLCVFIKWKCDFQHQNISELFLHDCAPVLVVRLCLAGAYMWLIGAWAFKIIRLIK